MQVCKLLSRKLFCTIFTASVFSFNCFAADMPKMPEMPELSSMPEIPEISNPALDDDFYTPGVPYTPFNKRKDNKKNDSEDGNAAVLKDAGNSTDLFSALLNPNSALTASDISSLYDSGLFNDVSSLNGVNTSTTSTNLLLQQVLTSLDELKAEQKKATPAERQELEAHIQDAHNFKSRDPSVLRFRINGYNLKDSLTTVFFSEPEYDGSFLLTADRKYFVNQKPRTETFYLLFKAVDSNGATITYSVQPSIVQDYKNENSYVYRMAQKRNLEAEKTGNLVVLRSIDDLNIDLLLDIDKK